MTRARRARRGWRTVAALFWLLGAAGTATAGPTPPISLEYVEGDLAGSTTIWSEDGKRVMGFIEYRQHRQGDRLHITRTAHFRDGSSDEDEADVRVGPRLESIAGRSIIRDTHRKPIVDLKIDVAGKRITGFYLDDGKREAVDEAADIGPGTYWGPLFNIVDPILQRLVPKTEFFMDPGKPPALARFAGPRNFAGHRMRLE